MQSGISVKIFCLAVATGAAIALGGCGEDDESSRMPFDYCKADTPPDTACWAQKRDPDSDNIALARRIADKHVNGSDPTELKWDWGETVMMLGIMELYRVTGEQRYVDFVAAWMDHHIEAGYEMGSSDTCAPASLAVELYRIAGDEKYRAVAEDALNYLYDEALRTSDGGINHLGTWDMLGVSMWVDSLFMFGNVLTRWGEYNDDGGALAEYASQFAIFTARLQKDGGFYTHASDETIFEQEPDVFWGRGNGWVLAAGYDHLRVRYNRGESVADMRDALGKLAAAAMQWQDEDTGLWWTVLNHPGETYLETSVAALFALGLARGYRYGYLGDGVLPSIRAAMQGVKSRITTEGDDAPVVTGVSGPTNPGTMEYYGNVSIRDDIGYGVGAVLMALVETSGLPLEAPTP